MDDFINAPPTKIIGTWYAVYVVLFLVIHHIILPFSRRFAEFNAPDKGYVVSSINSAINGLIVTYFALQIDNPIEFYKKPLTWSSPETSYVACIVIGYLCSDLTFQMWYGTEWNGWQINTVHHVTAIISFGALVYSEVAHGLIMTATILESTNPFMNGRYLAEKFGYKESHPNVYLAIGLIFTSSFFVIRILYFTQVGYHNLILHIEEYNKWQTPLFRNSFRMAYVVGLGLQYFWFIKIAKGCWKLLFGKSKKK